MRGWAFSLGSVAALPATAKLPHMGWNQLRRVRPSVLLEGVPPSAYFYFAHSYAALDAGDAGVAMCDHCGAVCGGARARKRLRGAISSGEIGRRRRARAGQFRGYAAMQRRPRMTLARRIIPCLDTDGERVVKGVNFVNLRDAGDPAELAARYNSEGADELVVLDIAASRDHRPDVSGNDSPRRRRAGDPAHGRRRRRQRGRGPRDLARGRRQAHGEYGGAASVRHC